VGGYNKKIKNNVMEVKVISSEVLDRIVTEEQLLLIYNISLDDWEVEKKVINTWEVGAKTPDGTLAVTPLFQIKIWLKSKKPIRTLDDIRLEFKEDLKLLSPSIAPIKYPTPVTGDPKLLELNIFDLHFGKICWSEETGQEYNLQVAAETFRACIDYFINTAQVYSIERILFPIGNDFFNSDRSSPYNSTTKGTPQEEDARWQKTFRTGRQLLVEAVNRLQNLAPVDIVMVPGNHDFERNFYLGDSLEGWFYNNKNVTVNNSPNPRKYYRYNNVLLGFTHGNEEKVTDLPIIMAQENPADWCVTKHREFHIGHWHQKKEIKYKSTEEYQGVMVKYMSSLSGTDSWHHKKGYISSKKSAEALIWDRKKGLTANLYYNI